jgi:hypothetical protein
MPVLRDVFDEDIQMLFFGINKKQIDEEDANFRKSDSMLRNQKSEKNC